MRQPLARSGLGAGSLGTTWLVWAVLWAAIQLPVFTTEAEAPPTEYQVKAALLYNFAKYVEWPAHAFVAPASPLVIGIAGEDPFGEELEKIVGGKTIGARAIVVKRLAKENPPVHCQVLFVGYSEKKRRKEILEKVQGLPVLTVGEGEEFLVQGGVIAFVRRENKVRFQVDLKTARKGQLTISSRVLNVADAVLGRADKEK